MVDNRTNPLAVRLWGYLSAVHARYGVDAPETLDDVFAGDVELHEVGKYGVCAFRGEYMYCAFPPHARFAATRDTWELLRERLTRVPRILHVVHPRNFPSVRITRKIGAVPYGVDSDGFIHYILTPERLRRYGQKIIPAARAEPTADR